MIISRGIRNNNPGNIRLSPGVHWQGQCDDQTDDSFVQFINAEHGIRAMVRILKSYQRAGVSTIAGAIKRWSPPAENDTTSYIAAVCAECGIWQSQAIVLDEIMPQLVTAIIRHENGQVPYTPEQIAAGIALA